MSSASIGFFNAYNARPLSLVEVGETFVAPPQYASICGLDHTLLLGPRGSGKTTLLKMLTRPARQRWFQRVGVPVPELPFCGIFIPADILWATQLEVAADSTEHQEFSQALSAAAVAANAIYAQVQAFEELFKDCSKPTVEALCSQLSNEWHLDAYPTMAGLRVAIRRRIAYLGVLREEHTSFFARETKPPTLDAQYRADFLDLLSVGAEVAADLAEQCGVNRWALCFDELEITPPWLQTKLIRSLRSTNQRFLFKLSASPINGSVEDPFLKASAQQGQDFSVVRLWYSGAAESRDFCYRLAADFLSRELDRKIDPRAVLGHSAFESEEKSASRGTYKPGSDFWKSLEVAAFHDPSLRKLLQERGIQIKGVGQINVKERDQFLRKIKPIVLMRNEFRTAGAPARRAALRSRKTSMLYTGADAIFAISDGNPRWLIGILRELVTRSPGKATIHRRIQADVVHKASKRFRILMGTVPQPLLRVAGGAVSLSELLDVLGEYFFSRQVRDEFPLDPVGSFTVDAATSDEVLTLLSVASAQGAIVQIDSERAIGAKSLRGARFRLSFLLSPEMRLPLRVYDSVGLSTCLSGSKRHRQLLTQSELFDEGHTT